jgi:integrase
MDQGMNRPRDRATGLGLLPRMEARPWADGKTISYRFHPVGSKPINLGTDRAEALRKVANLTSYTNDTGTIGRLWQQYQDSPRWLDLRERTQADYKEYSGPLLRVFGAVRACDISTTDVARYLRRERGEAPKRANREVSLLGNLIALAIERGDATANPCRGGQVSRNRERPRTMKPEESDINALVSFAASRGGRSVVVMMAAEFAALTGARRVELLGLHWPSFDAAEVRLERAKQGKGIKKIERIAVSPALADLRARLQAAATEPLMGAVFPNRAGNPYTGPGFAAMWGKLMRAAIAVEAVTRRFTFHDLRAFYATEYRELTGELPDMHASKVTTARVYDRSKAVKRKSL